MNKLVVITGATKGIGRALVQRFAREHFDVVACARTAGDLSILKEEVEKNFSVAVYGFAGDVANPSVVKSFCDYVLSLGRPIEVIVNNAGYFTPGRIMDEPEGALQRMMDVNLYSAYHVTRGLAGNMVANRRGTIFNLCSIASFMAYKNGGSYAITKFALLGFSKCLRAEMKEYGIRVTAVMPGATYTDSWAGTDLPEERFMKAEDIADVLFNAYSISERSVVEEIIIRPLLGDI